METLKSVRSGILVLIAALLPVLGAIWGVRWFVTQDGPSHLYNAHILVTSFASNSPFDAYYVVRWDPVPNWSGHLVTAVFVSLLPPWAAGAAVTTLTLVAFAASILWLRYRVAGPGGLPLAAVLAVLLSLNFTWLIGFTSFMLGASLFSITLGVWWGGRDRFRWSRAAAIGALIVAGYFCHLVPLLLTAFGLIVLALATPGPTRGVRLVRTATALLPLVPLMILYRSLSERGGPMTPGWGHLADPFSPAAWAARIAWVNPLALLSGKAIPLTTIEHASWVGLFMPTTWLMLAFTLIWYTRMRTRRGPQATDPNPRIGWAWLAALLLIGGILGPDSLGPIHGDYLSQRVVLLGLVALVPIVKLETTVWSERLAAAALVFALGVQSVIVLDYALTSNREAGAIAAARDAVGTNTRVATLLIDIGSRFRANPLRHADNLLGIGTGNVIWCNYETRYYYFPVQFRPGIARPDSAELEQIAITEGAENASLRAAMWDQVVNGYHDDIDAVVVWGNDPVLDAIDAPWFETVYRQGSVRVLRRRR